jgi:hypothetical protein
MNGLFRRHGTPASDRDGLVRELGRRYAGLLCYRYPQPRPAAETPDAEPEREVRP